MERVPATIEERSLLRQPGVSSSSRPAAPETRKWNHWKKSESRSLRIARRAEAPSLERTSILPLSNAASIWMGGGVEVI